MCETSYEKAQVKDWVAMGLRYNPIVLSEIKVAHGFLHIS